MHKLRPWISEDRRQRLGFTLVVLVTLGLFGFIGAVLFLPDLARGLVGPTAAAHAGQHFRTPSHRVHDLTFSFLFATAILGLLAQLRNPSRNVAGQLMALIPWVGLALVIPLTNYWVPPGTGFQIIATVLFGGLTLSATMLHPAGRRLFGSFRISRMNQVMLVMVIVAAVPLLALASTNIGLQRTGAGGNEHFDLGHYGFMAALSFTIIGVGLLASLRPDGWRLTAWVTGILPALFGLASLVYPDVDSSLGLVWALAAIAWGVMFVAVAELSQDPERRPNSGQRASGISPPRKSHRRRTGPVRFGIGERETAFGLTSAST